MFNYDNIGGKIKNWAQWIFIVEAISAVIGGIYIIIDSEFELILIGLLLAVLGPFAAWVTSWLLYGYGQMIENSDIMAEEYKRKNEKHEKVVAKNNAREQKRIVENAKASIANIDIDDYDFIDITCPNCRENLSYRKVDIKSGNVTCPMCDAQISL